MYYCAAFSSQPRRFSYRNLREGDIHEVAELCADCFEGPFGVMALSRGNAVKNFRDQIESRFESLALKGMVHTMIVCSDTETNGEIVGFLECGMLPPPPVQGVAIDNKTLKVQDSEGEKQDEEDDVRNAVAPYLGNVAVKESARRQGLGQSLVKLGIKIAQKEQSDVLYVIVDVKNIPALIMYEKFGFTAVLDERDLINRRGKEPRIFLKKDIAMEP